MVMPLSRANRSTGLRPTARLRMQISSGRAGVVGDDDLKGPAFTVTTYVLADGLGVGGKIG